MDFGGSSGAGNGLNFSADDLKHLTPSDQREIQTILENETQKAQVQSSIHGLTDMCFKKCITSSISSGKLAGKEESCISNCVERFMDANFAVLKHLETLRQHQ